MLTNIHQLRVKKKSTDESLIEDNEVTEYILI